MSHQSEDDRRLAVLRDRLVSSMSDAKWCRLIAAIEDLRMVALWSFLRDDREFSLGNFEVACIEDGVGIGDVGAVGPFAFWEVLKIRWPRFVDVRKESLRSPEVKEQPIAELRRRVERVGVFDLEEDDQGLVLYAYREPSSEERDEVRG